MEEITEHNQPTESPFELNEEFLEAIDLALNQDDLYTLQQLILPLHTADTAGIIALASQDQKTKIIAALDKQFNPEILVDMPRVVREQAIDRLGIEFTARLITELDDDEAFYVVEDLGESLQESLLSALPEANRQRIEEGLSYLEDSAGRLMDRRFVSVMEYWTVGQATDYLRQNRSIPDDFLEIYVLDSKHHPIGSITTSKLLCSYRHVPITDIMNKDIKIVHTYLSQEDVSYMFTKYELRSAPVVNKTDRLIGTISVNDIVEVVGEETEKDMLQLGGVETSDIHASAIATARHRIPWLVINLMTSILASKVIVIYQDTIDHMVVLASLMTIVSAIGGNAGAQSVTVAVRAIATKELTSANAFRVILKEIAACTLNGLGIAIIGGLVIYFWHSNAMVSVIFGSAIIFNLFIAGLMGSLIPVVLHRLGSDPAVSSSVLITTSTDILGFFSFLMLATLFLL